MLKEQHFCDKADKLFTAGSLIKKNSLYESIPQVVSGISLFTRQNTAHMKVSETSILVSLKQAHQCGVNIAETNFHVICNS